MAAQGQPDMAVVLDDLAPGDHRAKSDEGLIDLGQRLHFARAAANSGSGSGSSRSTRPPKTRMRMSMADMLSDSRYAVVEAGSAEEAPS